MKQVCIIGYGAIGPVHAAALENVANANLYAICDIDPDKRKRCTEKYSVVEYADFDKMLEDNNIDTVDGQVVSIEWYGDFAVKTVDNSFTAKSVILATGTSRRAPKIEGLKEFEGRGVSYCAVCDGFFYRGKTVAVLGEGEYAAEEAAYLKNLAQKVYILTNGQQAKTVIDGVEYIDKKLAAVKGETTVQSVEFEDGSTIETSGVFVAIGVAGAGDFARKLGVELNGNNIITDEKCATNIPGLYGAGDNLGGMLQVAKAVYQGAVAGSESAKFIRSVKGI